MGWRYKAGLALIGAVVVIWVSSAEVTQSIFTDYQQPFAITYLGASLLVLYLPIAFIKDWLCNRLRCELTGGNEFAQNGVSSDGTKSRSKLTEGKKLVRIEIQINPSDNQSDPVLSAQEEGVLLIAKQETRDEFCKEKRKFAAGDVSKYGLYLAPLWFVTEVCGSSGFYFTRMLVYSFPRTLGLAFMRIIHVTSPFLLVFSQDNRMLSSVAESTHQMRLS